MTVVSWDTVAAGQFLIPPQGICCSVGGFDGVHRGHRAILQHVLARSRATGEVPAAVTFRNPPRSLIAGDSYRGNLCTAEQRIKKLSEQGFCTVLMIDFSLQFGKLSGENFIYILCNFLGMKYLAAGSDFRCGYRGGTGTSDLALLADRYGFVLDIVPPVFDNGVRISSSVIRESVLSGALWTAERLTGSPYSLDISNISLHWQQHRMVIFRKDIQQVLPPDGRYKVLVLSATGKSEPGELCVSSDVLSCGVSSGMDDVSEIVFTGYFD